MPLLQIVLYLVIVGLILWAINTFIPLDAKIKQILNVFVVVVVIVWIIMLLMREAGMGSGPVIGLLG